jgi:2-polyprenyl-3-methyl-5-hydroxy-6-metoxy-1,4-benzoquinol methylase
MLNHVEQAEFVERINCINCGSAHLAELSRGNYSDQPLQGFLSEDPWGENPLPFLRTATWSLVKCKNCSQIFQRRILDKAWNERRFAQWMSADAIKEFEERLGSSCDRTFRASVHHVEHILRIEELTRSIRGGGPVRLLDFGCGFGHFLEACQHFGFEAVGVDRSVGRRSEARTTILPSLHGVSGQHFHTITLFEVLEHLDEPAEMLRSLSPLLVKGGVLVLETPDCTGVTDIRSRQDYLLVHPLEHINGFTHETLKSIAERQGFAMISRSSAVVTANPIKAVKRIAKYGLGRDGRSTQLYFRKS